MSYHATQFKFQDDVTRATVRQLTELMEGAHRSSKWSEVYAPLYQSLVLLLRVELGVTLTRKALACVTFGKDISWLHDLELAISMAIDDCEMEKMIQ